MTEGTLTILTSDDGEEVWVDRRLGEDVARDLLVHELGLDRREIHLTPVLMREASDVEKRIAGHEGETWKVECSERAASPEPWWRLEV